MNRIVKQYVTTVLGVLILGLCGIIMYQEKQTAGELSGWMTTGLLFIRSKDSLINLPK